MVLVLLSRPMYCALAKNDLKHFCTHLYTICKKEFVVYGMIVSLYVVLSSMSVCFSLHTETP